MNEVVPKLGNYWLFAAGRFSSGLPPIHFGREDGVERSLLRVACQSGTLAAPPWQGDASIRVLWHIGCQGEFDELVSMSFRPAKGRLSGWERLKRLGLVPITARNLILFYALFDVLFVNLPCSFDTFNTPFILIFFRFDAKVRKKVQFLFSDKFA